MIASLMNDSESTVFFDSNGYGYAFGGDKTDLNHMMSCVNQIEEVGGMHITSAIYVKDGDLINIIAEKDVKTETHCGLKRMVNLPLEHGKYITEVDITDEHRKHEPVSLVFETPEHAIPFDLPEDDDEVNHVIDKLIGLGIGVFAHHKILDKYIRTCEKEIISGGLKAYPITDTIKEHLYDTVLI